MPRVIHFEIHAENPERAAKFYATCFGWQVQKWPGPADYWLATTGPDDKPGINGGLLVRRGSGPVDGQAVNSFVCTLDVANADDALKTVLANGGTLALAKMPVPGVGWLFYAKDPEGNLFGCMQSDPGAR